MRYIPENRLVCADSIIPCEIWKTPKDYFDKKEPVKLPVPWPDIHCRKLFAEVDFSEMKATGKYVCSICGYVYDPAEHDGAAFEDLPDDWKCPRCKQGKDKFNPA